MIKLGNKAKDSITGFSGVVTGITEWLYGCRRILLEPQELKDGKPIDAVWFDEQRIEIVETSKPEVSPSSVAKIGGPKQDPVRS